MDLPNIKELEKLLKMCRKQGITDLEMGNFKFKFGDLPKDTGEPAFEEAPQTPTEEELAYWSSQPDPMAGRQ